MKDQKRIVVIVGPTASGKSAYAVRLAKEIGGEVISADSRQVYKGLNIGTGKITKKEMQGISHHLLDMVSPNKVFTADDFRKYAGQKIEQILKRGKTPIIVGGTGFYIDALVGNTQLPAVSTDPALRKILSKKTTDELFALLKRKDPKRAKTIDKHNPVRLIRALEIVNTLGKVPVNKKRKSPYEIQWIGINPDKKTLSKKIHARLFSRMKQGMVAEAQKLHKKGVSYKRMKELGLEYRYLALYLEGKKSKTDMLAELEIKINQYAKRQMTYWKKNKNIVWKET